MSEELLRKASEMRNAIDMIEGAMMGLGDFVDLPDLFEGTAEHVHIAPKMTVGEMRRVCAALAECTRIINSEEFAPDELRRHAQRVPWQPIETAPRDGSRILATGGGLGDVIEIVSYNERVGVWDTPEDTLDDRDDEAEGYNRPTKWQYLPNVSAVTSTYNCPEDK